MRRDPERVPTAPGPAPLVAEPRRSCYSYAREDAHFGSPVVGPESAALLVRRHPLQDGQVALVIGDVTGHNIRAAAITGQLRMATADLARTGRTPQEIMRQLSRLLPNFDLEAGATCLYALYDPRTRRAASPTLATRHPRSVIPMAGRSSSICPRAQSEAFY